MPSVHSDAEQIAAMTAANAAANGSKRAAFLTSWQLAIGVNPKAVLYRDGVEVYTASVAGALDGNGRLSIASNAFTVSSLGLTNIDDADIDTGLWELHVENASNPAIYFGHTVTRAGGPDDLALNDDLFEGGTITTSGIVFNAPALDTIAPVTTPPPAPVQASPVITGTDIAATAVALGQQPTVGNKLLVAVAYFAGSRAYTDPTSIGSTLWLDVSDFSTLKQNTAGTTAVTATGQTVRYISNKGSAGGHFTNATGWVLSQDAGGGYYLEADGVSQFVSNLASSAFVAADSFEFIFATRPSASAGSSDPWYAPSAVMIDDGEAGFAYHSSTVAKAFVGSTALSVAHVQGDDQLTTLRLGSGTLYAKIGTGADLGAGVAAGNVAVLTNAMGIGAPYHGAGGWPRFDGRLYQMIGKKTGYSTAERTFGQSYVLGKMDPVSSLVAPTVADNIGNSFTLIDSQTDAAAKMWTGLFVCHNAGATTGPYSVIVTPPAASGYKVLAQVAEFSELIGAAALDRTGKGTNNGSAGNLSVSTSLATTQASELAVALFSLQNGDSDANVVAPNGWTVLGVQDNAAAELGFLFAYRVLDATGTVTINPTWDSGSSGGANGIVATLKAGDNVDAPPTLGGGGSGGGGSGGTTPGSFDLTLLRNEMTQPHEYLLFGINPAWSWGTGPRYGSANPPSAWGIASPALTPWGVASTKRNTTPGNTNHRLAIFAIYSFEKRNGSWVAVGTQVTAPGQIDGSYYNYETNASSAANLRTSNGYLEVKFPSGGATYHFFPTFRTPISSVGAQHRAIVIKAALTLDNPAGVDDRATSDGCALMASADYWRSMSQGYDPANYSNDDMGIARARKPALFPNVSYHVCHTMVSDADINEFIAFVQTQGIL